MGTAGGLSKKETLLSTPGEIGDLWELYLQARGVKKEREPEDDKAGGANPSGGGLDSEQLFFLYLKFRLCNGSTIQKVFILQDFISGGGGSGDCRNTVFCVLENL